MKSIESALSIEQVVEQITKLRKVLDADVLMVEGPFAYDVRKEANDGLGRELDGARRNGIYVYTTQAEQVLYIGKGEYTSGHGIGYRSFAHLGRANIGSEDNLFPYHQWSDDDSVKPEISALISDGQFIIWTFPIEPDYFSSLVEVHLLSMHKHLTGDLPALNKKI